MPGPRLACFGGRKGGAQLLTTPTLLGSSGPELNGVEAGDQGPHRERVQAAWELAGLSGAGRHESGRLGLGPGGTVRSLLSALGGRLPHVPSCADPPSL